MRYLKRIIEHKLDIYARQYRVLILNGARQTGKYALLRHIFPTHRVIKFNAVQDIHGARRDPNHFLDAYKPPLILKGIQYVPELLPALLQRAEQLPYTANYVLSAVYDLRDQFDLRTLPDGLLGSLNLNPLTLRECMDVSGTPHWLEAYLEHPSQLERVIGVPQQDHQSMIHTVWRGGLPETLRMGDNELCDFFNDYLQTYAERDARRLAAIPDLGEFGLFLRTLCAAMGNPVDLEQIGAQAGIFAAKARIWRDVLSATYQWRELPSLEEGGPSTGFYCDSGLACALRGVTSAIALAISPELSQIFTCWAINNILNHLNAREQTPKAYNWRGREGSVALVLEQGDKLYPIDIRCVTEVSTEDTRGLAAFRKAFPKRAQMGLVLYAGKKCVRLGRHHLAIPWDVGVL